jgi:hypothetical protein
MRNIFDFFKIKIRENWNETRLLDSTDERWLDRSDFDADAPTKIICHGFMSNYLDGPGFLLRPGEGLRDLLHPFKEFLSFPSFHSFFPGILNF